jgi:hypothetical protein
MDPRRRDRSGVVVKEVAMAVPVELVLIVPLGAIVAGFVYLSRSRARIMRYHDIPTPRINEMTHGDGGG